MPPSHGIAGPTKTSRIQDIWKYPCRGPATCISLSTQIGRVSRPRAPSFANRGHSAGNVGPPLHFIFLKICTDLTALRVGSERLSSRVGPWSGWFLPERDPHDQDIRLSLAPGWTVDWGDKDALRTLNPTFETVLRSMLVVVSGRCGPAPVRLRQWAWNRVRFVWDRCQSTQSAFSFH
jgi:hypothetical protein